MTNRHQIYIWEATKTDLSKGFYELSTKAISYVYKEKQPSKNLLAFAEALHQHRKNVDYSRSFFREVANQIKNATTKAIMIEFWEEEDWKKPLRDMVKLAQNYQVIIVDTEITMVFFPTGEIKPFGAEYDWEELLGELSKADDAILAYKESNLPSTPTAYATWMRNLLDKELGQYGFTLVKTDVNESVDIHESWYCRDVEIGKQYIQFTHVGKRPYFWSHTHVYMSCDVVSDIYHRFNFEVHDRFYKNVNIFSVGLENFTDVDYCRASPLSEDLAQCHINDIINYIIKLIFDKVTNIKKLDDFINSWLLKQSDEYMERQNDGYDERERQGRIKQFITADEFELNGYYNPQRLIVARLANNLQYDRLCNFCEATKSFGANQQARATEWPKLVKYLKEEINPETFWQQYALVKAEEKRLDNERIQQLITQFKLNPEQEKIPVSDQWYYAKENLIWQRCCMGEHWQNGQVVGGKKLFNENEVQNLLAQFKDTGWRLPSYQELAMLSFNKVFIQNVAYITKEGFDYYERIEDRFSEHWITPFMQMCIVTLSENAQLYSSHSIGDKNLKGYVRLVKSVT